VSLARLLRLTVRTCRTQRRGKAHCEQMISALLPHKEKFSAPFFSSDLCQQPTYRDPSPTSTNGAQKAGCASRQRHRRRSDPRPVDAVLAGRCPKRQSRLASPTAHPISPCHASGALRWTLPLGLVASDIWLWGLSLVLRAGTLSTSDSAASFRVCCSELRRWYRRNEQFNGRQPFGFQIP
jgi:hypothetical protein